MIRSCAINKVILMGRLTHDPELRQTQTGIMSCRFTVAVDRNSSAQAQQNGQQQQTDFINVTAFNKTAEFVSKYLSKGKLCIVEGSLKTGSYIDKTHPDVKHFTTDVWADNVTFGETKASSAATGSYSQGGYAAPQPVRQEPAPSVAVGDINDFEDIINDNDSDLPF